MTGTAARRPAKFTEVDWTAGGTRAQAAGAEWSRWGPGAAADPEIAPPDVRVRSRGLGTWRYHNEKDDIRLVLKEEGDQNIRNN